MAIAAPEAPPTAPAAAPAQPAPDSRPVSRPAESVTSRSTRDFLTQKVKEYTEKEPEQKPTPAKDSEKAQPLVTPPTKTEKPADPDKPPAPIAKQEDTAKTTDPAAQDATPKKEVVAEEKLGPWQLKAKWEKQAKAAESEVAILREKLAKAADATSLQERLADREKRLTELENHMRFLDYSKSQDFNDKYHAPYVKAFERAVSEITQLKVNDEQNGARPATPDDFVRLARLPVSDLDAVAEEMFGRSSSRVIHHIERVKELAEARESALETAKKEGVERHKGQVENDRALSESLAQQWSQLISADEEREDFLKAKEEDDEWNTKLGKSKEFVDKAAQANSKDPALSPEQRAKILRDKATLRGRAIGFPMLRLENKRLKVELQKVQAELQGYKTSEPGNGQPASSSSHSVTTNPWDRVKAAAQKLASS